MDAQDIHNISEAYREVYTSPEELDEAVKGASRHDTEMRKAASKERRGGDKRLSPSKGKGYAAHAMQQAAYVDKKTKGKHIPGYTYAEEVDIYDIILTHLLDEGYAETPEAAQVIMVNMSEDWRDSIVEMDDFAAGGGNAKMKQTGMSKDQVVALGKKNLANVAKKQTPTKGEAPDTKASGSASARPQTTKSDVDLYKLKRRDDRSGEYSGSSTIRGKIGRLKDMEDLESLEQRRNQRWAKNELQPGVSGTRSVAGVEADYMRAQGRSFGVNPKDTEKSINTIMQRRKKAAGM